MKIALACPYGWEAPGGVQVHVRQLARRLEERGHRVIVLAPSRQSSPEPFVAGVGHPVRVPYNGSVAPICASPRSSRVVRRVLAEFRPDVVHVHEPLTPSTGMFAARWSRAPVVATFHAYADRAALFSAVAPVLRRTWRRLDVRVAVSEAARQFVTRRFPEGDVRIIPNGVEVDLFVKAEPADLPPGRRILFVNRLERRKGFSVMVEAFRRLAAEEPEALLVVAGDGSERTAVRSLPAGVRDRVIMLGNVPHDFLPPYHAASEVFCAPARSRESFGIVLVEAMAAGLPVIASDIPGYREVVRDGVDGILVPPEDPAALTAAVQRLLEHADAAKHLADAGRAQAERFSWDVVTREVEAAYEEAVARR